MQHKIDCVILACVNSLLDINECEIGQNECHTDAICTDTFGSYECNCKESFFGDGKICISEINKIMVCN